MLEHPEIAHRYLDEMMETSELDKNFLEFVEEYARAVYCYPYIQDLPHSLWQKIMGFLPETDVISLAQASKNTYKSFQSSTYASDIAQKRFFNHGVKELLHRVEGLLASIKMDQNFSDPLLASSVGETKPEVYISDENEESSTTSLPGKNRPVPSSLPGEVPEPTTIEYVYTIPEIRPVFSIEPLSTQRPTLVLDLARDLENLDENQAQEELKKTDHSLQQLIPLYHPEESEKIIGQLQIRKHQYVLICSEDYDLHIHTLPKNFTKEEFSVYNTKGSIQIDPHVDCVRELKICAQNKVSLPQGCTVLENAIVQAKSLKLGGDSQIKDLTLSITESLHLEEGASLKGQRLSSPLKVEENKVIFKKTIQNVTLQGSLDYDQVFFKTDVLKNKGSVKTKVMGLEAKEFKNKPGALVEWEQGFWETPTIINGGTFKAPKFFEPHAKFWINKTTGVVEAKSVFRLDNVEQYLDEGKTLVGNLFQLSAKRGEFFGNTQARWAIIGVLGDNISTNAETNFEIEHYLLLKASQNLFLNGNFNLKSHPEWDSVPLPEDIFSSLESLTGFYFCADKDIEDNAIIKSTNTGIYHQCKNYHQRKNSKAFGGFNQSGIFHDNHIRIQALEKIILANYTFSPNDLFLVGQKALLQGQAHIHNTTYLLLKELEQHQLSCLDTGSYEGTLDKVLFSGKTRIRDKMILNVKESFKRESSSIFQGVEHKDGTKPFMFVNVSEGDAQLSGTTTGFSSEYIKADQNVDQREYTTNSASYRSIAAQGTNQVESSFSTKHDLLFKGQKVLVAKRTNLQNEGTTKLKGKELIELRGKSVADSHILKAPEGLVRSLGAEVHSHDATKIDAQKTGLYNEIDSSVINDIYALIPYLVAQGLINKISTGYEIVNNLTKLGLSTLRDFIQHGFKSKDLEGDGKNASKFEKLLELIKQGEQGKDSGRKKFTAGREIVINSDHYIYSAISLNAPSIRRTTLLNVDVGRNDAKVLKNITAVDLSFLAHNKFQTNTSSSVVNAVFGSFFYSDFSTMSRDQLLQVARNIAIQQVGWPISLAYNLRRFVAFETLPNFARKGYEIYTVGQDIYKLYKESGLNKEAEARWAEFKRPSRFLPVVNTGVETLIELSSSVREAQGFYTQLRSCSPKVAIKNLTNLASKEAIKSLRHCTYQHLASWKTYENLAKVVSQHYHNQMAVRSLFQLDVGNYILANRMRYIGKVLDFPNKRILNDTAKLGSGYLAGSSCALSEQVTSLGDVKLQGGKRALNYTVEAGGKLTLSKELDFAGTDATLAGQTVDFVDGYKVKANALHLDAPELLFNGETPEEGFNGGDLMEQKGLFEGFRVTEVLDLQTDNKFYFDRSATSASKSFLCQGGALNIGNTQDIKLLADSFLQLKSMKENLTMEPGVTLEGKGGLKLFTPLSIIMGGKSVTKILKEKPFYYQGNIEVAGQYEVDFHTVRLIGGPGTEYEYTDGQTGETTIRPAEIVLEAGNKVEGQGTIFQTSGGDAVVTGQNGVKIEGLAQTIINTHNRTHPWDEISTKYQAAEFITPGKAVVNAPNGPVHIPGAQAHSGEGVDINSKETVNISSIKGQTRGKSRLSDSSKARKPRDEYHGSNIVATGNSKVSIISREGSIEGLEATFINPEGTNCLKAKEEINLGRPKVTHYFEGKSWNKEWGVNYPKNLFSYHTYQTGKDIIHALASDNPLENTLAAADVSLSGSLSHTTYKWTSQSLGAGGIVGKNLILEASTINVYNGYNMKIGQALHVSARVFNQNSATLRSQTKTHTQSISASVGGNSSLKFTSQRSKTKAVKHSISQTDVKGPAYLDIDTYNQHGGILTAQHVDGRIGTLNSTTPMNTSRTKTQTVGIGVSYNTVTQTTSVTQSCNVSSNKSRTTQNVTARKENEALKNSNMPDLVKALYYQSETTQSGVMGKEAGNLTIGKANLVGSVAENVTVLEKTSTKLPKNSESGFSVSAAANLSSIFSDQQAPAGTIGGGVTRNGYDIHASFNLPHLNKPEEASNVQKTTAEDLSPLQKMGFPTPSLSFMNNVIGQVGIRLPNGKNIEMPLGIPNMEAFKQLGNDAHVVIEKAEDVLAKTFSNNPAVLQTKDSLPLLELLLLENDELGLESKEISLRPEDSADTPPETPSGEAEQEDHLTEGQAFLEEFQRMWLEEILGHRKEDHVLAGGSDRIEENQDQTLKGGKNQEDTNEPCGFPIKGPVQEESTVFGRNDSSNFNADPQQDPQEDPQGGRDPVSTFHEAVELGVDAMTYDPESPSQGGGASKKPNSSSSDKMPKGSPFSPLPMPLEAPTSEPSPKGEEKSLKRSHSISHSSDKTALGKKEPPVPQGSSPYFPAVRDFQTPVEGPTSVLEELYEPLVIIRDGQTYTFTHRVSGTNYYAQSVESGKLAALVRKELHTNASNSIYTTRSVVALENNKLAVLFFDENKIPGTGSMGTFSGKGRFIQNTIYGPHGTQSLNGDFVGIANFACNTPFIPLYAVLGHEGQHYYWFRPKNYRTFLPGFVPNAPVQTQINTYKLLSSFSQDAIAKGITSFSTMPKCPHLSRADQLLFGPEGPWKYFQLTFKDYCKNVLTQEEITQVLGAVEKNLLQNRDLSLHMPLLSPEKAGVALEGLLKANEKCCAEIPSFIAEISFQNPGMNPKTFTPKIHSFLEELGNARYEDPSGFKTPPLSFSLLRGFLGVEQEINFCGGGAGSNGGFLHYSPAQGGTSDFYPAVANYREALNRRVSSITKTPLKNVSNMARLSKVFISYDPNQPSIRIANRVRFYPLSHKFSYDWSDPQISSRDTSFNWAYVKGGLILLNVYQNFREKVQQCPPTEALIKGSFNTSINILTNCVISNGLEYAIGHGGGLFFFGTSFLASFLPNYTPHQIGAQHSLLDQAIKEKDTSKYLEARGRIDYMTQAAALKTIFCHVPAWATKKTARCIITSIDILCPDLIPFVLNEIAPQVDKYVMYPINNKVIIPVKKYLQEIRDAHNKMSDSEKKQAAINLIILTGT